MFLGEISQILKQVRVCCNNTAVYVVITMSFFNISWDLLRKMQLKI